MRGYDDGPTIERVRELMQERDISRRAAIISVAGEGSLRRIEMKMNAAPVEADDSHLTSTLARYCAAMGMDTRACVERIDGVFMLDDTGFRIVSDDGVQTHVGGKFASAPADGRRVRAYGYSDRILALLDVESGRTFALAGMQDDIWYPVMLITMMLALCATVVTALVFNGVDGGARWFFLCLLAGVFTAPTVALLRHARMFERTASRGHQIMKSLPNLNGFMIAPY